MVTNITKELLKSPISPWLFDSYRQVKVCVHRHGLRKTLKSLQCYIFFLLCENSAPSCHCTVLSYTPDSRSRRGPLGDGSSGPGCPDTPNPSPQTPVLPEGSTRLIHSLYQSTSVTPSYLTSVSRLLSLRLVSSLWSTSESGLRPRSVVLYLDLLYILYLN